MFDDKFLDAVRAKKHYRIDYPGDIDYSWDEFLPFLDSHPRNKMTISGDKIKFNLLALEARGSTPQFAKYIISELKKTFPKNGISAHAFGGLTDQSKSFKIHRDKMDVFYLQVLGDIEWSVWEPNDTNWYNDSAYENLSSDQGKKLFTERFTCGKMIWIPRGTYHLVQPYTSRMGISFGVESEIDPSTYV